MGRRTLLLIAALVVAALGTTLVFLYVSGVDQRAAKDQELLKVLVAKTQVAPGTTASDAAASGAFEQQEVASGSVAPGALGDVTPISDQVALAPIFPGQQVLAQMFGSPFEGSGSGLALPKGTLAIAVQLGDPERVAGFVAPGSEVAVFATVPDGDGSKTQVLLPRVSVVAVGPSTVTTRTTTEEGGGTENVEEISRAILTLAVNQKDAQRIIQGQTEGPLYFGLLSEDSNVSKGGATTTTNLFN